MADQDEGPKEPTAWDRVGQAMADMAGVGGRMAQRNLALWNGISDHLRGPTYKVDDMTTDMARSWMAAMDTLDDLWTLWTRVPDRERVAADLPTAFLLFQPSGRDITVYAKGARPGKGRKVPGYSLEDPVWVRLPAGVEKPPPHAAIDVAGTSVEGAQALKTCLTTELGRARNAYMLSTAYPKEGVEHKPGTYSGIVYLTEPKVRPLANLRIVVEGRSAP